MAPLGGLHGVVGLPGGGCGGTVFRVHSGVTHWPQWLDRSFAREGRSIQQATRTIIIVNGVVRCSARHSFLRCCGFRLGCEGAIRDRFNGLSRSAAAGHNKLSAAIDLVHVV